jgi:hypothetical protein
MKRRIKKPRAMKLLEKTIPEHHATELLRDGRRRLMKMHTQNGQRWFIVPGGLVSNATARKILARRDAHVFNDDLFPNNPQTYRIRHIASDIDEKGGKTTRETPVIPNEA